MFNRRERRANRHHAAAQQLVDELTAELHSQVPHAPKDREDLLVRGGPHASPCGASPDDEGTCVARAPAVVVRKRKAPSSRENRWVPGGQTAMLCT
jgi:hypothetical protein